MLVTTTLLPLWPTSSENVPGLAGSPEALKRGPARTVRVCEGDQHFMSSCTVTTSLHRRQQNTQFSTASLKLLGCPKHKEALLRRPRSRYPRGGREASLHLHHHRSCMPQSDCLVTRHGPQLCQVTHCARDRTGESETALLCPGGRREGARHTPPSTSHTPNRRTQRTPEHREAKAESLGLGNRFRREATTAHLAALASTY